MKINPQAANIAQQAYSKNSNINKNENDSKTADINKQGNEELNLDISAKKETLSSNDLPQIKEKIASISEQLDVDYSKDSANFSKNNISFFEGSFLTSQATNLNESSAKLILE